MASPAAILNLAVIANTKQANAALLGTDARLRATAATSVKTGAVMKKAFLGIGFAAVGAATALYKIGEAFDDVSDTIANQTGASGKKLKSLEESFKNVVKAVPADFDQAAEAVGGLNQRLGLTGKPLEKLSKQVTQLALVTGTDVKENVEAVTRLFGDWSVATKDQADTLDGLFRASQATGVSVGDLSRSLVQFGSPLRQLGIDMDYAAAMFAAFEKEGVNTQTLMPGLRMALKNLSVPTETLGKTLKQFGVDAKEPGDALFQVTEAIAKAGSTAKANELAFAVFGARAGPDMAAAVREGRFALSDLVTEIQSGDSTISKAERSTRDFSEQWQLFKNQVMITLQPIATKFFETIGEGMRMLRKLDLGAAIQSLKEFWRNASIVRETFDKVASAVKDNLKGLTQFVRGAVKTISGVLTLNFDRAWDGVKDIFSAGAKNVVNILKLMVAPMRVAIEKIAELLGDVFSGAWKAAANVVENAANTILGTVHSLTKTINKGFQSIFKYTNSALKAFGVEPVAFSLANAVAQGAQGKQKGGVIHAARGRMVPGRGSGDKVPAMLEPGEVVLNRNAVAAMGGARKANRINRMIPRFAKGGTVPGNTSGLHPGILGLVNSLYSKYGGSVSSGVRGADVGSLHSTGQAADYVPSNWAGASAAVNAIGPKLLEGIYNPGVLGGSPVSWDSGAHVSPSFWGDEWGNHLDHIHLAIADGVSAAAGAVAKQIKRVMLSGPDGPLKEMGQAALDKVRGAANSYLSKQGGLAGDTASTPGAPIKGLPKSLAKFNQVYAAHVAPDYGGYRMPVPAIVQLANWAGLPGDTFAKIAHGESDYRPGAVGIDPGGTRGYGLWQITTGFSDADVRAATGGTDYGQMLNPVLNAKAAKSKYDAAGIDPWYGTQYLQSGGIVGGTVQKLAKGGHVKPPSIPQPHIPFDPANVGTAWWQSQHPIRGTGHPSAPKGYTPAPPSIALQFAQLDLAMTNAASTLDVADDRAVLDQRALLIQKQIRQVSNALSKKGVSAARRLALTQKLTDLKGQLNSIASDQQALYPSDFAAVTGSTSDTSAAEDAAAAAAAADLEAQKALTEAMAALTAEIAQQNALVNGALASDYTQALAYIGDLLSGSIGGLVAPRLSTAGAGSVVRT